MNTDQILNSIRRHSDKLGPKTQPDQCDPRFWTYDLGCNADLSVDALVCDLPGQMVDAFAAMPHAKATFATKTVNDDFWLRYCTVRYSF